MSRVLFLVFSALYGFECLSQSMVNLPILFQPVFGQNKIVLNDTINASQFGGKSSIEMLKFYISKVQLYQNDSLAYDEDYSYHLIDVSTPISLNFIVSIPEKLCFNRIQFKLGIDSLTNVSGAMGGDLDPTKGMYWTWQSGYVNFKLEGKNTLCKTNNNQFQFHLGGYRTPYSCLQIINLKVSEEKPLVIILDVEKFIKSIDLAAVNHIMSPSTAAVVLSEYLVKCFTNQR